MNDDGAEGLSAEGARRPRLHIRWSSSLQNLRFELESTRGQIESLEKVVKSDECAKEILNRCGRYLDDAEIAFKRILPRQLFVWEMLFLIQQNLLLITPIDELDTKWHALQKRLERNAKIKGECLRKQAFLDDIRQRLKNRERLDSRGLRNKMMQVRKSLDDLVIIDLWKNMQILRYTATFLVLGIFLQPRFLRLSYFPSISRCTTARVGMAVPVPLSARHLQEHSAQY